MKSLMPWIRTTSISPISREPSPESSPLAAERTIESNSKATISSMKMVHSPSELSQTSKNPSYTRCCYLFTTLDPPIPTSKSYPSYRIRNINIKSSMFFFTWPKTHSKPNNSLQSSSNSHKIRTPGERRLSTAQMSKCKQTNFSKEYSQSSSS